MRQEKKKARKNKRDKKKDNQGIKEQHVAEEKEVASRGFGTKDEEFAVDPVSNIVTFLLGIVA